jgi:hypothetical protein
VTVVTVLGREGTLAVRGARETAHAGISQVSVDLVARDPARLS